MTDRRESEMGKRSLTISAQLLIGFAMVLAFVIVLGFVSAVQTNRLYEQEKTMYEHPLQVKEAIDEIQITFSLMMRRENKTRCRKRNPRSTISKCSSASFTISI
jgi:CHASE3 domain sensor protein